MLSLSLKWTSVLEVDSSLEEFIVTLDDDSRFRVKAVVGKGYLDFSSVIKELREETHDHLLEN